MQRTTLNIALLFIFLPVPLFAISRFHNDILIGSRAIGYAGAFTSIADDSSAVYYNPAGLAFCADGLTMSSNAYYRRKTKTEGFSFSNRVENNSTGNIASFFGGTKKIEWNGQAFHLGFAVFIPHDEQVDQTMHGQGSLYEQMETTNIQKYFSDTTYYSIGFAKKLNGDAAVGLGVSAIDYSYSAQIYSAGILGPIEENSKFFVSSISNFDEHMSINVIELSPAMLFKLTPKFHIGGLVTFNKIVSQNYKKIADTATIITDADGTVLDTNGELGGFKPSIKRNELQNEGTQVKEWPARYRVGMSYGQSSLTYSLDLSYVGPTKGEGIQTNLEEVYNLQTGLEWHNQQGRSYSGGIYTNNDAQMGKLSTVNGSIKMKKMDQIGFALSMSEEIYSSSYRLSFTYQKGHSKFEDPLSDATPLTRQTRYTAYLSISK